MSQAPAPEKKPRIPWILKVLGTCVALAVTLSFLPGREILATVRDVPLQLWFIVFVVFLAGHFVGAAKWWIVTSRGDLPFTTAVKGHFAGLMANLCLPGGASGDIVRAGFVMRESQSKSRIAVGSVVDRLLDTFGLFALSCGGAVFALDSQKWLGGPLPKIGLLFLAGVTGIVLFPFIARRMSGISVVSKVMDAVDGYRQAPGKLALCLLMSLAVQSAFIGCNIALAAASGIHVPTAAWFFAWPLAKLFAMLPISMGGLGVREASLAALLSGFGAPAAKVVGVGLVWQTVLITSGLLGGATVFLSTKALESKATPKPFPRVEGADS